MIVQGSQEVGKAPNPIISRGDVAVKKQRSSNLELYRIICMLMIVAHHYVANSGLNFSGGPIVNNPNSFNSIFLSIFGAWGKTGINCFMMITGYYMCTSKISLKKFLKLLLWIYFYKLLLFPVFLAAGYESLSLKRLVELIAPFWKLSNNFTGNFLVFFLTIPFWNILIQNITERQHILLTMLLVTCYTVLGTIPSFTLTYNYISWFGVIYLIASYIRLYPHTVFQRKDLWGWVTLLSFLLASLSILRLKYWLIIDSNKFFALEIAVCMFLWFKNLDIHYNKVINAIGASTFGVLMIHANSDAMRKWLWQDVVDCVGKYSLPLGQLILYCVGTVLAIFLICTLIDQLRISTIERWFFNWYDNKISMKADRLVKKITQS